MAKHIGIVSVNYEGTALCYRSICIDAASVMGEYQHPQMTIHSFPLADYMHFVSRLDWEEVGGLLLESAERSHAPVPSLPFAQPTRRTTRLSL